MDPTTSPAPTAPECESACLFVGGADGVPLEPDSSPGVHHPERVAPRDYSGLGFWILRGLVIAGTLVVAARGIQRMWVLAEEPMRWAKVLGPHRFATLTSFSLVALALVLAVFSGPIVRGSARIWNALTRRVRPATRADEVILLFGAILILFQASLLFEVLGGF